MANRSYILEEREQNYFFECILTPFSLYLELTKWKLEGIARLYEEYAKQKIIGVPIDPE